MNIIRKITIWLPVAALIGLLLCANAYADATGTTTGTGNNTYPSGKPSIEPRDTNISDNSKSNQNIQGSNQETTTSVIGQGENSDIMKFRQLGENVADQNSKSNPNKPSSTQVKNCELHKTDIQNKVNAISGHAQASLKRLNSALANVENYQSKNNITVTDLSTLESAATSAQTTASSSVDALVSLKPPLVCGDSSVSTDVATFKAAVTQARTDLMAYRVTVINLLKAVQSAKQPASSQGGQQ